MTSKPKIVKKKKSSRIKKALPKEQEQAGGPEEPNKELTEQNIKLLTAISKEIARKIKSTPVFRKSMISNAIQDRAVRETIIKRTVKKLFR